MLTDLRMLNHPCIPEMNPAWSCCIIFWMCCWTLFARNLLRIFASVFIRDTDLSFTLCLFFICLFLLLVSGSYLLHRNYLSVLLCLQFPGTFWRGLIAGLLERFGKSHWWFHLGLRFCIWGDVWLQFFAIFIRMSILIVGWYSYSSSLNPFYIGFDSMNFLNCISMKLCSFLSTLNASLAW